MEAYEIDLGNIFASYRTEEFGGLSTTFTGDFDVAERFGAQAVQDTFERAYKEWKYDIRYLANLAMAANRKAWESHEKGDEGLTAIYSDAYHQCVYRAYAEEARFSAAEKKYFFEITD